MGKEKASTVPVEVIDAVSHLVMTAKGVAAIADAFDRTSEWPPEWEGEAMGVVSRSLETSIAEVCGVMPV